jgi:hypothetical protein
VVSILRDARKERAPQDEDLTWPPLPQDADPSPRSLMVRSAAAPRVSNHAGPEPPAIHHINGVFATDIMVSQL